MAIASYPPGVLLDVWGSPFEMTQPGTYPGAGLVPAGYGPTTVIVEGGGGQVELTRTEGARSTVSYADVYASQPAVGMVVNRLVRAVARVPLKVYAKPPKGKSVNGKPSFPEVDEDNTLYDLLHKPSPGFGHVSLKEWIAMPLYVHGNGLVAKFRANGPNTPPTQLFPLDWRYLQAWARIGEPVLVWATVQTGTMKWILPSETVYTAWTSPAGANGAWIGTSPLQQLGITIKIEDAAQRYSAASFEKGARPGGVFVIPADVDVKKNPEIIKQIKAGVEAMYGGVENSFRTAVIGGGTDWKPMAFNADEAQLVETRERNLEEVSGVYDYPLPGLKGMLTPELDAAIYKMCVSPTLLMIADRWQAQLVDPEPDWANFFLRFDLDELLYGDPLAVSDKMVGEVGAGIRTRNEARRALGLAPSDNPAADELEYLTRSGEGEIGKPTEQVAVQYTEMGEPPTTLTGEQTPPPPSAVPPPK